jgi:hypothetical protein
VEVPVPPPALEYDLRLLCAASSMICIMTSFLGFLGGGGGKGALRHPLAAEVLDKQKNCFHFSCGIKQPLVKFHSPLVFEFEVTMFWGARGLCTRSAFA